MGLRWISESDLAENEIVEGEIEKALETMFPYGAGRATYATVRHQLGVIAKVALREGWLNALGGLMSVSDVATHFNISERRARALIKNRYERFGLGMKVGREWLVHRAQLGDLEPDEKYRPKDQQG